MNAFLDDPAPLFTATDGGYRFARWNRPIAPVVFGVDDATIEGLKAGIAQTVAITGTPMGELDPEFGANFMWFFCREWEEIAEVPNLDRLVPDLDSVLADLAADGATRYRSFGFDSEGAIRICVLMVRVDEATADLSVQAVAAGETLQSLLLWSEAAFERESPIAQIPENNMVIVKPEYAALVRAAYDPAMPVASEDSAHALRLAAHARRLFEALGEAE